MTATRRRMAAIGTVTAQDPLVSAAMALEATSVGWREISSTGPVDPSAAAGSAFSRVPLGAAPGTRPDDDFATPITGAWHWNTWQKALAIGMARIAPLIGTVGDGTSANDKPGSTVFVAEASRPGFNDGRTARSPSVAAFAASSTSTATITVAGAGNFRQRAGSGFATAAANSLQRHAGAGRTGTAGGHAGRRGAANARLSLCAGANPATNPNAVAASFSNAVTANGVFAQINPSETLGKIQTSEARAQSGQGQPGQGQPGQGRPELALTSDAAGVYAKLIDLSQPIAGKANATHVDGTRSFISASVSANPSAAAALYLANVVNAPSSGPAAGQTVEAFQIGPTPGVSTRSGAGKSVADPLHGKIMASVGALNNSLALP